MKRNELIKKYIAFFKKKKHKEILNASLIPEHDPTVLFTTAGMHPLVPFLLGQKHPLGRRLVNVQKCIRTTDIEEVGDISHHTFIEMLGNWSLGDYWKKEAIEWSYEFLIKVLKLDKDRLAVSCFKGDKDASKDNEAAKIWLELGIPKERIAFLGKEDNWWGPAGETGPCGPCSEMYYYIGGKRVPKKFDVNDKDWMEIWNDVFMQYNKVKNGKYESLKQKNVDTGMGLERILAVLKGYDDNYLTPLWQPIIKKIEKLSKKKYGKNKQEIRVIRIIADHLKAACFILNEGISPSNVEQGYVLRRLIRRTIRYGKELGIENFTKKVAEAIFPIYKDYKDLQKNKKKILDELDKEEIKFEKILEDGLKKAEKIFNKKTPIHRGKFVKLMQLEEKRDILHRTFVKRRQGKRYNIREVGVSEKELDNAIVSGEEAFLLYQSYGFPIEMITELARDKNLIVPHNEFNKELKKHQEVSRKAAKGKFKSGLADSSEETTKLHTATHLLLSALRKVLRNKNIHQKGSNITPERLRFDFNFDRKLTKKELEKVEKLVNEKIKEGIEVKCEEMDLSKAKKKGIKGMFEYGRKVTVYFIGKFSVEICAGPHVKNTKELGKFKILKEESVAAGVRRIKAALE